MGGLFDAIRGAMLTMGGYGDARREEEKLQSEKKYREETISTTREKTAAEKDLAAAQREHTKELQTRGFTHEMKKQESEFNHQAAMQKNLVEAQRSESKFARENAYEIAYLQTQTQYQISKLERGTRLEIADMEDQYRRDALAVEKKLKETGLSLDREKMLKEYGVAKASALLKVYEIAANKVLGESGLYTSATKEGLQKNLKMGEELVNNLITSIDPDKKMFGGDHFKFITAAQVTSPPLRESSVPSALSGGFDQTAIVQRPPVFDPSAPPAPMPPRFSLSPKDTFKFQTPIAHALSSPDPEAAAEEYATILRTDPNVTLEGVPDIDFKTYKDQSAQYILDEVRKRRGKSPLPSLDFGGR